MMQRLFPPTNDFVYRSSRIALWLLGAVLLMKIAIALGSMFNTHYAASVADGVPLDTYSPEAANTVLLMFKLLGLAQLVMGLVGVLILVRYRALVPFLLLLLIGEYLARKALSMSLPLMSLSNAAVSAGPEPGFYVSLGVFGLMLVAFVLSLRTKRNRT